MPVVSQVEARVPCSASGLPHRVWWGPGGGCGPKTPPRIVLSVWPALRFSSKIRFWWAATRGGNAIWKPWQILSQEIGFKGFNVGGPFGGAGCWGHRNLKHCQPRKFSTASKFPKGGHPQPACVCIPPFNFADFENARFGSEVRPAHTKTLRRRGKICRHLCPRRKL